ncbi:MAG: hypothetical protein CM1200mP4_0530 [Rhodospirillaceae bacterium]|nr:MAG: hypothetical protein CM1200mP4_0530 [Rhodospirillaceae bacterium]
MLLGNATVTKLFCETPIFCQQSCNLIGSALQLGPRAIPIGVAQTIVSPPKRQLSGQEPKPQNFSVCISMAYFFQNTEYPTNTG